MKVKHGEKLAEVLKPYSITVPVFAREYLKISNSASYILQARETFPMPYIIAICYILDVSPSVFGESNDIMETPFEKDLIRTGSKVKFIYSNKGNTSNRLDYGNFVIKDYFGSIIKELTESVVGDLKIFDCFFEQKGTKPHQEYHTGNRLYLETIEDLLARGSLKNYQRVMAMPLSLADKTQEPLIKMAVLQTYPESFYHIYYCLKHYSNEVEFIVDRVPTRLYSYLLMNSDKKQVFIVEQDKIRMSGSSYISTPHNLFIDTFSRNRKEEGNNIYDSYEREFEEMIFINGANNIRVSADTWKATTKSLIKKAEKAKKIIISNADGDDFSEEDSIIEELERIDKELEGLRKKEKMIEKIDNSEKK